MTPTTPAYCRMSVKVNAAMPYPMLYGSTARLSRTTRRAPTDGVEIRTTAASSK